MEDFINHPNTFLSYICTVKPTKMKELTAKQKAARKLASDYSGFLMEQEALVNRLVDQRLKQLEPVIKRRIAQMIDERFHAVMSNHRTASQP